MTKDQYAKMTAATRAFSDRLPFGNGLLRLPTLLCGGIYLLTLACLVFTRDERFIRASVVPAVCFLVVTMLRPRIYRQRPYDVFGIPPVGKWEPGKGKSMPSRHTVSAVAVSLAVVYVFPVTSVAVCMALLSLLVATLRVLTGQHFPSDVIVAVLLAFVISAVGYTI